jgi:hypothetical protein
MIPDIETVGAAAGKQAADICKARVLEGHTWCQPMLSEKVKAANLEAQQLRNSTSEDDRAVAIYWASYAAAFEAGIKH